MPAAVDSLLSQFSIESLILFIILFVAAVKCVGELFEWLYGKVKKYFDIKDEKETRHEEIVKKLDNLEFKMDKQEQSNIVQDKYIDKISRQLDEQDKNSQQFRDILDNQIIKFTEFENQLKVLNDRMQDSTRAYIIEKHHYYCYQMKAIDDMSLQDLERRFMYYKAAGGNTFIDSLMDEIRSLPKMTLEKMKEVR